MLVAGEGGGGSTVLVNVHACNARGDMHSVHVLFTRRVEERLEKKNRSCDTELAGFRAREFTSRLFFFFFSSAPVNRGDLPRRNVANFAVEKIEKRHERVSARKTWIFISNKRAALSYTSEVISSAGMKG